MDTTQQRIVIGLIGLGFAVVSVGVFLFVAGTSLAHSVILGLIVGVVFVGAAFAFINSDFYLHPERHIVTASTILTAVIVGTCLTLLYSASTPEAPAWAIATVFVTTSFLSGVVITRTIESRKRVQLQPRQEAIWTGKKVKNNFMGRGLRKHLHLLSENENQVDFAARPPVIQAVIFCGLPLELSALAIWGFTNFYGIQSIWNGLASGNYWYIGKFAFVVFIAGVLAIASILEKPPERKEAKREETSHKYFNLRNVLRAMVVGSVVAAWFAIGAPLGSWLYHYIIDDLSHIWLLISLPLIAWTAARFMIWWESVIMVTNLVFYKGSDSWLLGDPMSTMERSKMTNATIEVGFFRWLARYQVMKREGTGQSDLEFRHIRVTHGEILSQVLTQ